MAHVERVPEGAVLDMHLLWCDANNWACVSNEYKLYRALRLYIATLPYCSCSLSIWNVNWPFLTISKYASYHLLRAASFGPGNFARGLKYSRYSAMPTRYVSDKKSNVGMTAIISTGVLKRQMRPLFTQQTSAKPNFPRRQHSPLHATSDLGTSGSFRAVLHPPNLMQSY